MGLPVEKPEGAAGEVARVLACRTYFQVLDLPTAADGTVNPTIDDACVKKAYRQKLLLVHPDKNGGAPHSARAFDRVKVALEKLAQEKSRKQYASYLSKV